MNLFGFPAEGQDALSSMGDWSGLGSTLGGLYGAAQSVGINNNVNNAVAPALAQNSSTTSAQIQALQDQIAQNRQQAQDMYTNAQGQIGTANQGLQSNIGTMTANLNALSDPNSPYMQQARQAIERKDAAAGRNSQWGDRETQLAGTLAQYVGQYAPGINNSINSAQQQISQNNQGLASLYSTANAPADRNTLALISMLQAQQAGATAQNTVGRQAANGQANSLSNLFTQGGSALGSLAGLFGGSSGGSGISNYFGSQGSLANGITGYGSGLDNTYGSTGIGGYGSGVGSIYDNAGYGYGSLPAGDYFGGGGFGGTPTADYGNNYAYY